MGISSVRLGLKAYTLGWKCAIPFLKTNSRLKDGWDQRTLSGGLPAPAHIWIQAASGGEAYLAWEILKHLTSPFSESLRVLVTTNTLQGYETLTRAADEINSRKNGLAVQPWYFPFDAPDIMDRTVSHVRPKVALILETEIWPGFLSACKKNEVKILLANGRMSTKSLAGYLTWPGMFRALAPDAIMAVSEADARRFGTLFGRKNVWVMPNIKFDRMADAAPMAHSNNPLKSLIPSDSSFVVFGSVRREEKTDVTHLAAGLMHERPASILGLFPRHMHHMKIWESAMNSAGLNWTLRSRLTGPATPGTVILWDAFGELVPAYGLAHAAFVGGSLAPLGGQNFLEPLTCGVTPVIGPHWTNFAWVGQGLFDAGLAVKTTDWTTAQNALISILDAPPSRQSIAKRAKAYIKDHTGGAQAVCKQVADCLNKD
ncbi:3-deoxy-D-manno-octulosonic acid transferase [Pseudodesulfovibrio sp. JC047]|uniref:3-deoxy-D-manno-octulosonic acid transferase n=1 Tax=Pseudodesulfovibrio sp. JC047 TaxID=2683199 RepID=UPI0013CFF208|nr:glycosyltransferase N-terminal domain-containing protein [Pseudodesulfovibrio sp. JC047]NDV17972.1 3-deoxy-D-manno-octulosonic acid transferase [Pseudodesulfovibrio sp. JC047]